MSDAIFKYFMFRTTVSDSCAVSAIYTYSRAYCFTCLSLIFCLGFNSLTITFAINCCTWYEFDFQSAFKKTLGQFVIVFFEDTRKITSLRKSDYIIKTTEVLLRIIKDSRIIRQAIQ